jgi:hypothetical protein
MVTADNARQLAHMVVRLLEPADRAPTAATRTGSTAASAG